MFDRLKNSLRYRLGSMTRPVRNFFYRWRYSKLQKNGDDFSIISQNCIGTFMYHDLGLEFRTPTVNLFMTAEDFIRFAENLDHYLGIDAAKIVFDESAQESYPVGVLDDVRIHFVHYPDEEAVVEIWNRRRVRVNRQKLYMVMTDKDGCIGEIRQRFLNLPYRKVFFSSREIEHPDVIYMPCFKDHKEVGGVTDFCSILGKRYFEKYFDHIKWLTK